MGWLFQAQVSSRTDEALSLAVKLWIKFALERPSLIHGRFVRHFQWESIFPPDLCLCILIFNWLVTPPPPKKKRTRRRRKLSSAVCRCANIILTSSLRLALRLLHTKCHLGYVILKSMISMIISTAPATTFPSPQKKKKKN